MAKVEFISTKNCNMVGIGKINNLNIERETDFGVYLNGVELGEILLPKRYIPDNYKIGDSIDVFIYRDSEDRLIATTETPAAMVGDFAFMKVVSVNRVGAFLEWGLPKDLFVPFKEQRIKMEEEKHYIVYIYIDVETGRIAASSKIDKFIDNTHAELVEGQEVNALIAQQTDLGYKAIINNSHWGVLYSNEIFEKIEKGQKLKVFIKKVREDGKIDITLYKPGYEKVNNLSEKILSILKENGGTIDVNDKSPADKIYSLFGMSKKTFKKAVGALYKQRIIAIEKDSIKLI